MYIGNALIDRYDHAFRLAARLPDRHAVFLFVYQAIVAAEEHYLRRRFGAEYEEYEKSVNRYVPALSRLCEVFAGMRFDWRKSIRNDLGTIVGLAIGLILLPVWRAYFLYGREATHAAAMRALWLSLGIGMIYLFVLKLKKRDRLFNASATPQKPR